MWNNTYNWSKNRLSIVYMEQVSMLLDRRLVVRESESTMTRERLNRLWARPFDSSSSCIPSWARSRRRWKRRRWKEAVGRKEGYTKYGGKRDDGATRIEKEEADEGRRETRRGWDEKFSLASLDVFIRAALVWPWDIYLSYESEGRRQKIRSSVKIA